MVHRQDTVFYFALQMLIIILVGLQIRQNGADCRKCSVLPARFSARPDTLRSRQSDWSCLCRHTELILGMGYKTHRVLVASVVAALRVEAAAVEGIFDTKIV